MLASLDDINIIIELEQSKLFFSDLIATLDIKVLHISLTDTINIFNICV